MKNTFPWGRCVLAALALAAFSVAVIYTSLWWKMRFESADAAATVLAVLPNAFGGIGTVEVDFRPKYDFTCKEMLVVESDLLYESSDDVAPLVRGLRAQLVIINQAGEVVREEEIAEDWFRLTRVDAETQSALPVFQFQPVRPGDYRLRITTTQPAVALVGVPHRVVARYELCGIENLKTTLSGGIGLVAAMVGLALSLGLITRTRKRRESV